MNGMASRSLFLAMLSAAVLSLAVPFAVSADSPEAEPPTETRTAPAAAVEQQAAGPAGAVPADGPPLDDDEFSPAAGKCVCRCTCPSSGSFVYQCHVLPPFASGCGDLNGQQCSPPFSTCNVPDVLQGCVPEIVAPVACR